MCLFFFFKQKTAYELRISDWSSDVCSSDLLLACSSCSDFLDVEPEEALVKEQMYRNVFDADAAVIGVYGKLLSLAEQHVVLNELRADLLTVTNRANPYLQEINTNDVSAISAENPNINPRKFYDVNLKSKKTKK